MHAASSLSSGEDAAAWRRAPLRRTGPPAQGKVIPLEPHVLDGLPQAPIEEVILARRSVRHYATDRPLTFEHFSIVLDRSARPLSADCLAWDGPPLHDNYRSTLATLARLAPLGSRTGVQLVVASARPWPLVVDHCPRAWLSSTSERTSTAVSRSGVSASTSTTAASSVRVRHTP
jgi:hypothetical protein